MGSWSASAPSEPGAAGPGDADLQPARTCPSLPPPRRLQAEEKPKSSDQSEPSPASSEAVQTCDLQAPAAAKRRTWGLTVPVPGCTILGSSPAASRESPGTCPSVRVQPRRRQASGALRRCPPRTSAPCCLGSSRHLLGLTPRLTPHGEERDSRWGVRLGPAKQALVGPRAQAQSGAPESKRHGGRGALPPESEAPTNNRCHLLCCSGALARGQLGFSLDFGREETLPKFPWALGRDLAD